MAYEVHLKQFEGPLDLLLHLIEKAEMDIRDIFVSEITAEYLSYMRQLDELDMDTASEFLSMAATLLQIKSKSLLPKPPRENEVEAEIDPEEYLIRQLREYKAFKEAGERLRMLREDSLGNFTKLPEEYVLPPPEFCFTETSLDALYEAFLEVLGRKEEEERKPAAHEIVRDAVTVRGRINYIRQLLLQKEKLSFTDLFETGASNLEVVVTFMAVLDMLTRHEIELQQSRAYGPITIKARNLIGNDADIAYMDEE